MAGYRSQKDNALRPDLWYGKWGWIIEGSGIDDTHTPSPTLTLTKYREESGHTYRTSPKEAKVESTMQRHTLWKCFVSLLSSNIRSCCIRRTLFWSLSHCLGVFCSAGRVIYACCKSAPSIKDQNHTYIHIQIWKGNIFIHDTIVYIIRYDR